MSDPRDFIEEAWGFVDRYNEYLREMTTGELDGVPATELAWMVAALLASRKEQWGREVEEEGEME